MPTLSQLHYIVTVDQLGHFGKAAEACHVAQPSLSMQIQKVEEELGIQIFDRSQKPIRATEKGRRLIEQARVVLRENNRLLEVSRMDSLEISGPLRLGIIPTVAPYLLPLFIEKFASHYAKVTLKIDELKTQDIIAGLQSDAIDAGILATPLHEPGLEEVPLYNEEFLLFIGADHPLAKRKRIREEELDGREMWLLQDGHCLRNQMIKICSLRGERGAFPNVQFEGGNLETLRYLIKQGRGYTIVPRLFVDGLPEAEVRKFVKEFESPVPSREISLVHKAKHWKADIFQALQKTISATLPGDVMRPSSREKRNLSPT
jgi:LysR family transcriptional regulator, hydrogen peroxide-inducible genes activator